MKRRTRWIRWARETSRRRRQIWATAAIRRRETDFAKRWAFVEGFPAGVIFHSEKPNPFYGRRYPYKREDGYLRWLYRLEGSPDA